MVVQPDLHFCDYLKPRNIICDLEADTWQDAVGQLAGLLHREEESFSKEEVVELCLERERACSTVIAPKLAMPHARIKGLKSVLIAIGIVRKGVMFTLEERGAVHVVVLILTPHEDPGLYLQVLAALMRDLGSPDAVERLAAFKQPEEVHQHFIERDLLPKYLKAGDLVNPHPVTLQEGDWLKTAITTFCSRHVMDIPVIDEEGDLRGVLAIEDLMRMSLPEHLLWMHDLSTILRFEPFAELLKRDTETKVADFMRDDYISVDADTPAIQLAKLFLTEKVRQVLVVQGRKLLGVVNVNDFITRVFWA